MLRNVLAVCTEQAWAVHGREVDRESVTDDGRRVASVILTPAGRGRLAAEIAQLPGVRAPRTGDRGPGTPLDQE